MLPFHVANIANCSQQIILCVFDFIFYFSVKLWIPFLNPFIIYSS